MLRNTNTLGDSILLIAALCFHSVFEGIAIGVAGKRQSQIGLGFVQSSELACMFLGTSQL
jgi:zinc transporter 1/2/3